MPRGDSSLNMLIVAAILALGVGYYVPQTFSAKPAIESVKTAAADSVKADSPAKPKAAAKSGWATSAAGRVEPIGGEVRIGAQMPGRVAEVLVNGASWSVVRERRTYEEILAEETLADWQT